MTLSLCQPFLWPSYNDLDNDKMEQKSPYNLWLTILSPKGENFSDNVSESLSHMKIIGSDEYIPCYIKLKNATYMR